MHAVTFWVTGRGTIRMPENLAGRVVELARNEADYAADLLERLVRTPSPSCGEAKAVELVRCEMEALGLDEVFVDSIGSVVGRLGHGSKVILYDSHLDTVGIGERSGWKVDPFGAERRDGVIYGRGACDDKGGVASMVTALKVLKNLAEEGDFTLYVVGIVQEEDCEGLALSVLLEERGLTPDCVVLGEPSNLAISRGHRGRAEIEVVTRGKSCHASAPQRGDNAIYRMAPIVEGIKWMPAKLNGDPFLGQGSIVVTTIGCSTPSRNALPDSCTVYIDRRFVPTDTRESIAREIDEIARFTDGEVRVTTYAKPSHKGLVMERERFFPAWIVDEDDPAVVGGIETYRLLFGEGPKVGKWDFSTDGNYSMGVRSISTIGFGPGEEIHTHSVDDQVRIDDLWKAAAFYALFPFVYSR
jgi:putative selenium metabolism hydrolase